MMSSNNRIIAVLVAVFGLALVAIFLFNPGPQLELALRMLIVTGAVFVAVNGLFRRDPAALTVAVGLGVLSFGLFTSQRAFLYAGLVIVLGGFFLLSRRTKTIPRATGA